MGQNHKTTIDLHIARLRTRAKELQDPATRGVILGVLDLLDSHLGEFDDAPQGVTVEFKR